jgi:hypothetical protein
MKNSGGTERKKLRSALLTLAGLAIFIMAATAAIAHSHDDHKCHRDCPQCQFLKYFSAETQTARADIILWPVICPNYHITDQVVSRKSLNKESHPSHAPPAV